MTNYNEAVTEARTLVKRSEDDQWRLAELTWEQVEAGKSRRQWAQDIGVSPDHAEKLYKLWARFGADDRRHSFAQCYEMVSRRADTPEEAARIRDERRALPTIRNMPPERKAEVARELLSEPQVAEHVVRDDTARTSVRRALDERYEDAPKPYPTRPDTPGSEPFELLHEFRKLHIAMDKIVRLVTSGLAVVNDAERDALLKEITWLRTALDHTESGLNAGSLDEALRAFQEEWL